MDRMNGLSRRQMLQAMGAAAVFPSILAGCATGGSGTPNIRALMSAGGSGRAFKGGLDLFNQKFSGKYHVTADQIANESILSKATTQFASGSATYDILSLNSDWLPGVARFLHPLNEYVERDKVDVARDFGPRTQQALSVDGKLLGIPVRLGIDILFYRKDLLSEAGIQPPTTHQQYWAAVRQLTLKDTSGKVTRYGSSLKGQSPSWTVDSMGHFLLGAGLRFLTPDGKEPDPSLTSSTAQELLDGARAAIHDGTMPPATGWTYDDNVRAFQTSRMSMSDEYSARALLVEDPKQSQAAGKMGYAPWMMEKLGPYPPIHHGSTWQFTIDKNSPNKDAAWELLKFMGGMDAQKLMATKWSNGPTLLKVLDDPDYLKLDPSAPTVKSVLEGPGWIPEFQVAQSAKLTQATHQQFQAFYLDRQSSTQTLQNIASELSKILKGAG